MTKGKTSKQQQPKAQHSSGVHTTPEYAQLESSLSNGPTYALAAYHAITPPLNALWVTRAAM